MAWITYDPNGHNAVDRRGRPVPATYEIDWTADDVPCLSPWAMDKSASGVDLEETNNGKN
jgi:hypothetical protein